MPTYPWDQAVCDPSQRITGYNFTEFEQRIEKDDRWKYVFDDVTGEVLGYMRASSGFVEMVDRNGESVYTDEIPVRPSLISPIDFVAPPAGRAGVAAARLATRLAGGAARKTSLINFALSRLRQVAQAIRAAAKKSPSEVARGLAAQLAKKTGKVKVNLCGTGELAEHINVNPLLSQQTMGVPNLVKAKAEEIGNLFSRASVDEIVANNAMHGTVNWMKTMLGAAKILRPGGRVSIAPYIGGDIAAHTNEIAAALRAAGFRNVQIVAGKVVEAVL